MKATEKYDRRAERVGSLLCVGLDSDVKRLPAAFHEGKSPQLAFNRQIIDALRGVMRLLLSSTSPFTRSVAPMACGSWKHQWLICAIAIRTF